MQEKKRIIFPSSMTIDKRNKDFAYFRFNAFDAKTPGLYPSAKFFQENPSNLLSSHRIEDVLGSEELSASGTRYKIKVIVDTGTDLSTYNLGSSTVNNVGITGNYECGAFGSDGVHICVSDGVCYRLSHTGTSTTNIGTFTQARPDIAGYDGLYYWWLSQNEIYKQIGGAAPTVAFNNLGITPRFVTFLGDQMVIMAEDAGGVVVLFWDKSDLDLFDKRVHIPNCRLVAGSVVNGRLMLITGVGSTSNPKEHYGRIVVSAFDGEKFVEINSIKAGQNDVEYVDQTGVGSANNMLVFSVENNTSDENADLFQNYIYRVEENGSIEAVALPNEDLYGEAHIVRVFYDFILFATRGEGTEGPRIYINENSNSDFNYYDDFEETIQITNFQEDPFSRHKLAGVAVAFEKLFGQTDDPNAPTTGEELEIYYRVSDRDVWTLLGTITPQKVRDEVNLRRNQSAEYLAGDEVGLPEQVYMITRMPDQSSLPEFNEIQYKFVSKRGFSIIGAWHGFDYISRQTLN